MVFFCVLCVLEQEDVILVWEVNLVVFDVLAVVAVGRCLGVVEDVEATADAEAMEVAEALRFVKLATRTSACVRAFVSEPAVRKST